MFFTFYTFSQVHRFRSQKICSKNFKLDLSTFDICWIYSPFMSNHTFSNVKLSDLEKQMLFYKTSYFIKYWNLHMAFFKGKYRLLSFDKTFLQNRLLLEKTVKILFFGMKWGTQWWNSFEKKVNGSNLLLAA